jgi:hypothetical protein
MQTKLQAKGALSLFREAVNVDRGCKLRHVETGKPLRSQGQIVSQFDFFS